MPKHSYHRLRTENPKEYWRLRWQTYKKTHNKQKEIVAEILEKLLSRNKRRENYFTREDVDTAITEVRGSDRRTLTNWFNVLWKLEYLHQPSINIFSINTKKAVELELVCRVPPEYSKGQQRLREFLK